MNIEQVQARIEEIEYEVNDLRYKLIQPLQKEITRIIAGLLIESVKEYPEGTGLNGIKMGMGGWVLDDHGTEEIHRDFQHNTLSTRHELDKWCRILLKEVGFEIFDMTLEQARKIVIDSFH